MSTQHVYETINENDCFIYDQVVKTHLSHSASPVDFTGLVPASVLSVWSVVSLFALEVNKWEEEETSVKGCGALNWISSIFPLFTYDYHMPPGAYTYR